MVDSIRRYFPYLTEGVSRVETAQAAAAQSAAAVGIQREGILKWRPATGTEEFGAHRCRRIHASTANRVTRDLAQRVAANVARIGEEKGKKGVEGCTDR